MGTKDPNYYAGTHLTGRGDPAVFLRLHWGAAGLDAEQEVKPEDCERLRLSALDSDDAFAHVVYESVPLIFRALQSARRVVVQEGSTRAMPMGEMRRAVVHASGGWGDE